MSTNLGPDFPNATADSDDQCDDSRLPWSLQAVACLFLILGVLHVTELVLQFTVFGCFYLDPFGPVFILMGRGILLKRETWRYWAVLVCWFVVAVVCIGFVVLLWLVASGSTMVEELITSKPGALRNIVAGVLAVGLFYVWPLYVLTRPAIVRLFRTATTRAANGPATRAARGSFARWTFSLRALLLLMALAAFVSWRLSDIDFLHEVHHESMVTPKGEFVNGIELAFRRSRFSNRPDQILYAVLSHESSQMPGIAALHSARDSQGGWIELPNGQLFVLPGRKQLYEIHDGKVYTCDERILWKELEAYLFSNPKRYDLESLLNHVWASRGNHGKPPEKRAEEY